MTMPRRATACLTAVLASIAALSPAAAHATTHRTAPAPALARHAVSASPISLTAQNRFRPGGDIELTADAGLDARGIAITRATVVGPHGMKTVMSPAADTADLIGTIHVPADLKGTWIRLTMYTPDGHSVSTIVYHA